MYWASSTDQKSVPQKRRQQWSEGSAGHHLDPRNPSYYFQTTPELAEIGNKTHLNCCNQLLRFLLDFRKVADVVAHSVIVTQVYLDSQYGKKRLF